MTITSWLRRTYRRWRYRGVRLVCAYCGEPVEGGTTGAPPYLVQAGGLHIQCLVGPGIARCPVCTTHVMLYIAQSARVFHFECVNGHQFEVDL